MQKTTVYLDPADYRALKRIAARKKRQPAQLVREAVAEYVSGLKGTLTAPAVSQTGGDRP